MQSRNLWTRVGYDRKLVWAVLLTCSSLSLALYISVASAWAELDYQASGDREFLACLLSFMQHL